MKGKADKIHEKRPGLSGKRIFPMGEGGGDKYLCLLAENGWNVERSAVLKASFSLTYDFSLLEKRSRSLIQRFGFLEVAM